MCGFVAIIDHRSVDQMVLKCATNSLSHRGPDGDGTWLSPDGKVGLGSRRLAIVDTTNLGKMPMLAADGRVAIVYNGEVYNFRELRNELLASGHEFGSSSDTEVILRGYLEWGTEIVNKLDGMFGFVLYDGREPTQAGILVARDRIGEKPVLIMAQDQRLVIASELRALLSVPTTTRNIDPQALNSFLANGYLPGELSLIKGVRKLLPGHLAWYNIPQAKWEERRYWSFPDLYSVSMSLEEAAEHTFQLLCKSVSRQLLADVPVGIFLSGGIDSSLVTAAAARISAKPIKTFTISFPDGGALDELEQAKVVARSFGTEHHVLHFSGNMIEEFDWLADRLDEPLGDMSLIPTSMVSRLASQHVKVALGGDGGDELFGGYESYINDSIRNWMPAPMRDFVGGTSCQLPIGTKGRARLSALKGDDKEGFLARTLLFNRNDRDKMLSSEMKQLLEYPAECHRAYLWPENSSDYSESAMRTDLQSYLPDNILVKVDRASMLHSLEVRAPFLAREIVEFATGQLKTSLKLENTTKAVLKCAAQKYVPHYKSANRKQGFSMPLHLYRGCSWICAARDAVDSLPSDWFNKGHLNRLLARAEGSEAIRAYFFPLILLARWRVRFGVC